MIKFYKIKNIHWKEKISLKMLTEYISEICSAHNKSESLNIFMFFI